MFKFSRTLQSKLRIKCDVCAVESKFAIATIATSAIGQQAIGPNLQLLPPSDWTQIQRCDRTRHLCPQCGNHETLVETVQLMIRTKRWV